MYTVNKCDFIHPRIQYSGQKVVLEYVFVNNTRYEILSKTHIVDKEPATIAGQLRCR